METIIVGLANIDFNKKAVPEKYPLLRTIQHIANNHKKYSIILDNLSK